MSGKLRVFVAHSFDDAPATDGSISDRQVAEWFINLMKSPDLRFDVTTGSEGMPVRIEEKVEARIASSACVIAIFTKRHYDSLRSLWLPPQFVLCESALALGLFQNSTKVIGGFYEEGLDPKDLALVTVGGLELVPFRRNSLTQNRGKFVSYLMRIPVIVRSSAFPDIRGKWRIQVELNSDPPRRYEERADITQQFGASFEGSFVGPDPGDENKHLRQDVHGQFVDRHSAVYSYRNASGQFTEFGAGVLQLDPSHRKAWGASVSCGISGTSPTVASVSLVKLPTRRVVRQSAQGE